MVQFMFMFMFMCGVYNVMAVVVRSADKSRMQPCPEDGGDGAGRGRDEGANGRDIEDVPRREDVGVRDVDEPQTSCKVVQ